jgi:hypothetical protein
MKHYFSIVHNDKDKDSAYGVVFPDLPGVAWMSRSMPPSSKPSTKLPVIVT